MVADRVEEDTAGVAHRDPGDTAAQEVVDMVAALVLQHYQYFHLHSHPKNHHRLMYFRGINIFPRELKMSQTYFYKIYSHQLRAGNFPALSVIRRWR